MPLYLFHPVGYTTDDLQFMWQTGDPVQMDAIALPQFDIRQEDIDYGNCTKFYPGTGNVLVMNPIFLDIFQQQVTMIISKERSCLIIHILMYSILLLVSTSS